MLGESFVQAPAFNANGLRPGRPQAEHLSAPTKRGAFVGIECRAGVLEAEVFARGGLTPNLSPRGRGETALTLGRRSRDRGVMAAHHVGFRSAQVATEAARKSAGVKAIEKVCRDLQRAACLFECSWNWERPPAACGFARRRREPYVRPHFGRPQLQARRPIDAPGEIHP